MEITKWTTIDVHHNSNETHLAERERKRLERMGYEYQQTDAGSDYDFTDQYIKSGKSRCVIEAKPSQIKNST